jgi:hypothetical protein
MESVESGLAEALAETVLTSTGPMWLAHRTLYATSPSTVFARLRALHRAIGSGTPGYGAANSWQLQVGYCYLTLGVLGQFSVLSASDQLAVFRELCDAAGRDACLDGLEGMFFTGLLTASATADSELFDHGCGLWAKAGRSVVPGGYLPCTVLFSSAECSFFAVERDRFPELTAVRDLRTIGGERRFCRDFPASFATESAVLAAWVGKAAEWACRFGASYAGSAQGGAADPMLCADAGSSVKAAVGSFEADLAGDEKLLSSHSAAGHGIPASGSDGFTPVIAGDAAPVRVLSESGLLALRTEIGDEPADSVPEHDGILVIPTRTCLSGPGVRSLLYRVGHSWSVNGLPRRPGPSAPGDLGALRMFAQALADRIEQPRASADDIAEVPVRRDLHLPGGRSDISAEEALRLIGEGLARRIMGP